MLETIEFPVLYIWVMVVMLWYLSLGFSFYYGIYLEMRRKEKKLDSDKE